MSERLRVLCQRGMTSFMTYPKATPASGSAKPTAPPVPKWPKLRGLGPKGRRGIVGLKPSPKVTSSWRIGQKPSDCGEVASASSSADSSRPGSSSAAYSRATPRADAVAVGRGDLGPAPLRRVDHAQRRVARRVEVAEHLHAARRRSSVVESAVGRAARAHWKITSAQRRRSARGTPTCTSAPSGPATRGEPRPHVSPLTRRTTSPIRCP